MVVTDPIPLYGCGIWDCHRRQETDGISAENRSRQSSIILSVSARAGNPCDYESNIRRPLGSGAKEGMTLEHKQQNKAK